jgi:hypothetical protein
MPPPGSVPQAMPIWAADPERAARVLRRRGVEAMRWPGREQIPFRRGACPGTVAWLDRGLLLPLGCALTPPLLDGMVNAIHEAIGTRANVGRAVPRMRVDLPLT